MLASTIAFALLLGLYGVGASVGLPGWLAALGGLAVFGVLPGWLLVRALLPALSPARAIGLGICLTPIVMALSALVIVIGASWGALGPTLAIIEAIALVALAIRDRGRPFGEDRAWWLTFLAGLVVSLLVLAPNFGSLRARAGTHGLLHAAISESIVDRGLPPENPYFADEPVLYYWLYHLSVAPLAGDADPLLAFALSNGILLLGTLLLLHGLAVRLFGRPGIGPLAAALGFLGLNPFGWIVFLSSQRADTLAEVQASKPPYFFYRWLASGWDDRVTATLTKFLNVSSNQATVASGLVLLWLGLRAVQGDVENRRGHLVLAALATFACCVFEPLVALGVLIPLGLGLGVTAVMAWRRRATGSLRAKIETTIAIGVGGFLSLIVLWPWMGAALDEENPALATAEPSRHWIGLFATCGPMIVLAAWATLPRLREGRRDVLLLVVFVVVLAAMALGLQAAEDCEYKFLRLLALPLGVLAAERVATGWQRSRGWKVGLAILLPLVLIPTNAIAWTAAVAFARGESKFAWKEGAFVRLPEDAPPSQVLQQIRRETPPDAIVIDDPIFFPSNVAGRLHHNEIPIFAGRALFTDEKYYLTDRYPDLSARLELCRQLFRANGQLSDEQIRMLRDLGRPVVLLLRERFTRAEDGKRKRTGYDPQMPAALAQQGIFQPAFRSGNHLVYRLLPERR